MPGSEQTVLQAGVSEKGAGYRAVGLSLALDGA